VHPLELGILRNVLHVHHARLHSAVREQKDGQEHAVRTGGDHEVDLAQASTVEAWSDDEGGGARQSRQDAAALAQEGHARREVVEGVDLGLFVTGQGGDGHQRVDVEAEGLFGGEPSCGGMGLIEETALFQVRHDVADGGGRDRDTVLLAERTAAHRLTGLDEFRDDGVENAA